jgi:hypothetical protein
MVTLSERTANVSSMVLQQVSVVIYTNQVSKIYGSNYVFARNRTRDNSHSHKYEYKNEAKIYVKFRFRDQIP